MTVRCRYEPIAQNGFVNLPKQLKIDEGYFGKGFYFTRCHRFQWHLRAAFALVQLMWRCRYSDYYNCGFSLATLEVESTFLMSFTLMGRPYPVTQHPSPKLNTHQPPLHAQADALDNGLLGRSCGDVPHRCCGTDSHDSHYVTVRKKGHYYPCPPCEQPDFVTRLLCSTLLLCCLLRRSSSSGTGARCCGWTIDQTAI